MSDATVMIFTFFVGYALLRSRRGNGLNIKFKMSPVSIRV